MSLTGFLLSLAYATERINTLQQQAWETECSVSLSLSSVDNSCHGGLTGPDISDLFFIIELRIVLFFFSSSFLPLAVFTPWLFCLGSQTQGEKRELIIRYGKRKKLAHKWANGHCIDASKDTEGNTVTRFYLYLYLWLWRWNLGHLTPPLWFVQKMRNVLSP